jgi:hypothetical protein
MRTPTVEQLATITVLRKASLRSAYQDQQAAGLMTLEKLGFKLKDLEQPRKVAERSSRR